MGERFTLLLILVASISLAIAALWLFSQAELDSSINLLVIGALLSLIASLSAGVLKCVDSILKDDSDNGNGTPRKK